MQFSKDVLNSSCEIINLRIRSNIERNIKIQDFDFNLQRDQEIIREKISTEEITTPIEKIRGH